MIAEDLLLAAGRKGLPRRSCELICCESCAEGKRHAVDRTFAVGLIEVDGYSDVISHLCPRCTTDIAMEIEEEAAVAAGHHVDAPWHLRLAIDLHTDRHGLSPARLQLLRTSAADEHVWVDSVDCDLCAEFHGLSAVLLDLLQQRELARGGKE